MSDHSAIRISEGPRSRTWRYRGFEFSMVAKKIGPFVRCHCYSFSMPDNGIGIRYPFVKYGESRLLRAVMREIDKTIEEDLDCIANNKPPVFVDENGQPLRGLFDDGKRSGAGIVSLDLDISGPHHVGDASVDVASDSGVGYVRPPLKLVAPRHPTEGDPFIK